MSNHQTRREALELAARLTQQTDPDSLIYIAEQFLKYIENGIPEENSPKYLTQLDKSFHDFINSGLLFSNIGTVLTFRPYQYQNVLAKTISNGRSTTVLSARQMGTSLMCSLYAWWFAMKNPNTTVCILETPLIRGMEMITRIGELSDLNRESSLEIIECNKATIRFSNGSSIIARGAVPDSISSSSSNLIIIPTASSVPYTHTEKFKEILEMLKESSTQIIMMSCAGEPKGLFYEVVKKPFEFGFQTTTLLWNLHPQRDDEWADIKIKNIGERKWHQEYMCQFVE